MNYLLIILADAETNTESNKILGLPKSVFVILIIFALILFLLLIYFVYFSFRLKEYEIAIIEKNGQFKRVSKKRVVYLIPFVEKLAAKIDIRSQLFSFNKTTLICDKNNNEFIVAVSILFSIKDAIKFYYQYQNSMNLLQTTINSLLQAYFSLSSFNLIERMTPSDKEKLIKAIGSKVDDAFGIELSDIFLVVSK